MIGMSAVNNLPVNGYQNARKNSPASSGIPEKYSASALDGIVADAVDISDAARQLYSSHQQMPAAENVESIGGLPAPENIHRLSESTEGRFAGANLSGLRKYMNLGSGAGDTGLMAMNMNRKSIGGRIESILQAAGITLGKNEKLTLSVDAKNRITVGGVKDKKKLEAITRALNDDKLLAREMRRHVANGKINEALRNQADFDRRAVSAGDAGESSDDLFTDRGIRAFIVEEYLQENADISLSELSVEKGADGTVSILGMNSDLNALLSDDGELAATVANILENDEAASGFGVSLEYANGSISDSGTVDAAKRKFEDIQELVLGLAGQHLETLKANTDLADIDERFLEMLGRGFSIVASDDGSFTVKAPEDMDRSLKQVFTDIVNKALSIYGESKDSYTGGSRSGSIGDLAGAFVEQHQFEHGDTGEYKHQAVINFGAGPSDIEVISEDADKAREQENRKLSQELGNQLRGMLEEGGVDVDAGLEMEINQDGRIAVLGDKDDPDVRKAQILIDQFTKEAKSSGLKAAEPDGETEKNRRDVREGGANDGKTRHVPAGFRDRQVVSSSEKAMDDAFSRQMMRSILDKIRPGDDLSRPETYLSRDEMNFLNWHKTLRAGDTVDTLYGGDVPRTSKVKEPRYASPAMPGAATDADDAGRYADDARGTYLELLDSMQQFHDGRKDSKYTFVSF